MTAVNMFFTAVISVAAFALVFLLFPNAVKHLLRMLANSVFGTALLILLNQYGAIFGASLAINVPSVVTAFVLGVPGVAALLIIKFMFGI